MNINLVHQHSALFFPPVQPPSVTRPFLPRDLFGALIETGEATTTAGSSFARYVRQKGVKIPCSRGTNVVAARVGQIVDIEKEKTVPSDDDLFHFGREPEASCTVTVRHVESGGCSFVTRYHKIVYSTLNTDFFNAGVRKPYPIDIEEGVCIGQANEYGYILFEVALILTSFDPSADWIPENTEPIDPIPYLYLAERKWFDSFSGESGPPFNRKYIDKVSIERRNGLNMFVVSYRVNRFKPISFLLYIPLFSQMDPADEQMMLLIQDAALSGKEVDIAKRDCCYFDEPIVFGVRLI